MALETGGVDSLSRSSHHKRSNKKQQGHDGGGVQSPKKQLQSLMGTNIPEITVLETPIADLVGALMPCESIVCLLVFVVFPCVHSQYIVFPAHVYSFQIRPSSSLVRIFYFVGNIFLRLIFLTLLLFCCTNTWSFNLPTPIDIAGFTAWSSQREPTQVFTLLQTLYHAFDRVANKRSVFKVETIGDCYMAGMIERCQVCDRR